MIILHIVEPFAAGISTFIHQLVSYLPDDKHIILHGERPEVEDYHNIINSFPKGNVVFEKWEHAQREIHPLKDLKAFFYLWKKIRHLQYDVIHLHSSKAGFLGRIACRMVGINRVIYTPNGGSFSRTDISVSKAQMFTRLERFANRFSGVVICAGDSELQTFTKAGINARCINNGTVILPQIPNKAYKESKNPFTILFCGNITFQKNPTLFNEIAKQFEGNPDIRFVWVGDGLDRGLINSNNIEVTGWLSKSEVQQKMEQADLYLSCSLWEGLSYAVLEAMATGLPLLLLPCVGNKDLISENKNGYFFNTADEACIRIKELSENTEKCVEMGKESVNLCTTHFNAEQQINKYKGEYLFLLNNYER